mgnify:FL=1
MLDKKKMDMFEKDREKWNEKQKRIIDDHDYYNRTYFGSPTVGGIIIFAIILALIIVGILNG